MSNKGFYTNTSNVRFLDKVIADLRECDSFDFSVSFIKKAGLVLLYDKIEESLKRGAKGRLLTSTYQNFTDISSLEMFLSLQEKYPNFKCHLDYDSFGDDGFHTKGYIFSFRDRHEVIIGSSNITRFALLLNKELDVSIIMDGSDPVLLEIETEFERLWTATHPLDREIVKRYVTRLEYAISRWDMDFMDPESNRPIKPNIMQRQALREIQRYRDMNVDRALVVAATGSGKTYLSAFDALNYDSRKLLFVVHKDIILEEAMKTFMRIFGTARTYGIYTGNKKELDADFLFASNQVLSRHLDLFAPDEFDYIVIDEVHHAAASTYQSIVQYFKPGFLLGMTATPDRMDGQSVYDLFGNNVPYDLRLREALENELIVPFRYYGIKDSLLDYADEASPEGVRRIIQSASSRIHSVFVREQIEKYRPKGTKLRCIGFCRSVEHARLMADSMREQGYGTTYLSGQNTYGERSKAFEELQDDSNDLSIIFAVDILNEGLDIPSMNMVLFLRPTDSSTIFIQQLGRGLRKYHGKGYLTVLDFIANSYKRSVQIAIALGSLSKSGSIDKITIADYVRTGFESLELPGIEIHMDRESRDEILKSIENTNFNSIAMLKQDYLNFKSYLKIGPGEYPMPTDFLNSEVEVDLMRYTKKFESYYDFLLKVGEDVPFFSKEETNVIRSLSWFLPLIRKEEFAIVKSLFDGPKAKSDIVKEIKETGEYVEDSFEHAISMLENKLVWTRPSSFMQLVNENGESLSLSFSMDSQTFSIWIKDIVEYGLRRYESQSFGKKGLVKLYFRYTGPKAFMALNNPNLFYMSGVHYLSNGLSLFVNLNKDADIEERLNYKDRFITNKILQWESQTGTTLTNSKGTRLLETGRAHIFVRKAKHEDNVEMPFVYLGEGTLTNPQISDNPGKCLLFDIILDHEVPEAYKYDFGIADPDEVLKA